MTDRERIQLIRHLRSRAQEGASGTEIARALLTHPMVDRMLAYRVLMEAFGMTLRDARECEWLLGEDSGEEIEAINTCWASSLRTPGAWPSRSVWLEIQETAPIMVTLRLFEYDPVPQVAAVQVEWGDGMKSETQTSRLPLSHTYGGPGSYAFDCQVLGTGWAIKRLLNLAVRLDGGTTVHVFRDPW